jgi:hypothetical protein
MEHATTVPDPAQTPRVKTRIVDGIPVPIPPEGRDWLTVGEVAEALSVSPHSVYWWMKRGQKTSSGKRVNLKRVTISNVHRIYPDAVLEFLRQTSAPRSAEVGAA